jgi:hypothetical protein
MQHLDEGTIHSWLDGALSAEESARVEAHVSECPQCAAAVAEARGFIAASSRILTALDHAPRGVVPVAPQVRWWNRTAWRTAAAMLVVAAGSLVVVRSGGRDARIATNVDTASMHGGPTRTSAANSRLPITVQGNPSPSTAPSSASQGGDFSGKAVAPAVQSNIPAGENKEVAKAAGGAASEERLRSSASARPEPAPQALLQSHVAGVAVLDSTSEQTPLKVVGAPITPGAKVTLYEVAPGDTVTLTELVRFQLDYVVTTGVGELRAARQSAGKSAAPAPTPRIDTAVVSAPDSKRVAGVGGVRAQSAPVSAPPVQVVNGVTTITWKDSATGNILKLSGHMPVERLQEIRRRIERERAAAAAAAKKKP